MPDLILHQREFHPHFQFSSLKTVMTDFPLLMLFLEKERGWLASVELNSKGDSAYHKAELLCRCGQQISIHPVTPFG